MKTESTPQICPRCGKQFTEPPALSRQDNRTEICPLCGTREALESLGIDKLEQEQIITTIRFYSNRKRE
ncbi:hypothetical protein [Ileibacterium valens]|uniref:Uncharacterized protein n=2 Tax=Erysipelotrichaceae TaxID=128827 RepID=A0A1U7NH38_9FIRM|nr:hypothetical protein [Ileibacterium valens]OLU37288.1 hypothetical protein BM735_10740 [Erysipelotrichaceae bacterium NYU-BL-F16]OLU40795.1 hypothetical protein BO222_04315 [Ileibacterium valens]OLU41086.1 hypothetical protein BO224_04240 [Erysipelotrichaceae bacterium NYU-BL-E8]OLU44727.1 hypothetical protein BO223_07280 [Faecalibaculum rodentium]